jgi:hypothetical protein
MVRPDAERQAVTMAYFSGDWYLDEDGFTYLRTYEGKLESSWSGGVVFWASRAVLDDISYMQRKLAEERPQYEWDQIKINDQSGSAYFVASDAGGEQSPAGYPIKRDNEGRYEIGFGWSWYQIEQNDLSPETVVIRAYDDEGMRI